MEVSTQVQAPAKITLADLLGKIEAQALVITALGGRIDQLEAATKPANKSERDMTDDDARAILVGVHKDLKHNDAAKATGLSYGQVYSCRGEYTFRHIHKELKARPEGFTNPWKKAS